MTGATAKPPLVSVLMPVYNCADFVDEAIDCILRQTFTDFEFLIVDDASTDDTWEHLQKHSDPRIRLFRNETNKGLAQNLNELLEIARGEFIARMDGDDACLPELLETELQLFGEPEVVAAGVWYISIDADNQVLSEHRLPLEPKEIAIGLRTACDVILHGGTSFRRSALMQIGGYRPRLGTAEDYDLLLRLSEAGQLRNAPGYLYFYRQHAGGSGLSAPVRQEQCALLARMLGIERERRGADSLETYSDAELKRIKRGAIPRPRGTRAEATANLQELARRVHRASLYSLAFRVLLRAVRLQPWNIKTYAQIVAMALNPGTHSRTSRRFRNHCRFLLKRGRPCPSRVGFHGILGRRRGRQRRRP